MIHPRRSRLLLISLLSMLLGGLVCLFYANLFMWIQFSSLLLVAAYGYRLLVQFYFFTWKNSVQKLIIDTQSGYQLQLTTGKTYTAQLKPLAIITRYFILLRFECMDNAQVVPVLLLPDSETAEQLAELRRNL